MKDKLPEIAPNQKMKSDAAKVALNTLIRDYNERQSAIIPPRVYRVFDLRTRQYVYSDERDEVCKHGRLLVICSACPPAPSSGNEEHDYAHCAGWTVIGRPRHLEDVAKGNSDCPCKCHKREEHDDKDCRYKTVEASWRCDCSCHAPRKEAVCKEMIGPAFCGQDLPCPTHSPASSKKEEAVKRLYSLADDAYAAGDNARCRQILDIADLVRSL